MATDADSPADDDDLHAESDATDPQEGEADSLAEPVGRSVAGTRESVYLARITVLQLRVSELESELAERERDLQTVRDRYEQVLDGPATYPGDPLDDFEPRRAERTDGRTVADGGARIADDSDSEPGPGLLDRLRRLYDRLR